LLFCPLIEMIIKYLFGNC